MYEQVNKGQQAEDLAAKVLLSYGFVVHAMNWRHDHCEIDIIASNKDVLHFIEVKARWGLSFGEPEEAVSKLKFKRIQRAAREYLYQHPKWQKVQYDIIAIQYNDEKFSLRFVEDIFFE